MMLYIPLNLCATMEDVARIGEQGYITLSDLVRIHYAIYHTMDDFNGGLNIFDLLKEKLSFYYDNPKSWNLNNMKNEIRNSPYPQEEFMMTLDEILTQDMITCYGF